MLKKHIILILSLFLINLSALAAPNYSFTIDNTNTNANINTNYYINEEITTPITQVGFEDKTTTTNTPTTNPGRFENKTTTTTNQGGFLGEYTNPEEPETGLEIVWNQWHADVRNYFLKHNDIPRKSLCYFFLKVSKYKMISDIVFIYIPESSLEPIENPKIKANYPCYLYNDKTKKYYILTSHNNVSRHLFTEDPYSIENNFKIKEVNMFVIPNFIELQTIILKYKSFNGRQILQFPQSSKRNIVSISAGITNIKRIQGGYFKSSSFNDIERQ